MNTAVSLLHEPHRTRKPWLVRTWGEVNAETGNQRRYSKSFRFRDEALAYKAECEVLINKHGPRDPSNVTLTELVEDFRVARFGGLSFGSQESYENTFQQALKFFGPSRKIHTIGRRDAEMFIASRDRVDGRAGSLSSWSRRKHVQNIRGLLAAGLAWGYLESNPWQLARFERSSSIRITPTSKAWHHLTPSEFEQFMAVVELPQRRVLYVLMYGCGLRYGEAVNTRIENVDLENQRIHIKNRTPSPEIPPFTIKADGQCQTSKERSVPIPSACLPILAVAMGLAMKAGGFLALTSERFEIVKGHWRLCQEGKPWARHKWRPWQSSDLLNNTPRDTKAFLKRAGITLVASFTLHAFRKSYAQNLANAGTPVKTLAKLLGHSDTRVTLEYYNMTNDANDLAAKRVMDQLFGPTIVVDVG